ncbi:MAG: prepilin peptidase [Lachnospiraceae bacterium]
MLIYISVFCTGAAIFFYLNKIIYQTLLLNSIKDIFSHYILIGLLGGHTAVGCYFRFGLELQTIIVFIFLTILTAIAIIDKETMKIPNELIIGVTIVAIISIHFFPEIALLSRVIGIISVSGILLTITLIVPGAFGGGDIKLMAASGIILGGKSCLTAFIIAVLTAGAYGIYLLATHKIGRKDHFAFGPFLCIGIAAAILGGEQLQQFFF